MVAEVNEVLTNLRLEVFADIPRKDAETAIRVFKAIETAANDSDAKA